jgi:hypothetical protein
LKVHSTEGGKQGQATVFFAISAYPLRSLRERAF